MPVDQQSLRGAAPPDDRILKLFYQFLVRCASQMDPFERSHAAIGNNSIMRPRSSPAVRLGECCSLVAIHSGCSMTIL